MHYTADWYTDLHLSHLDNLVGYTKPAFRTCVIRYQT